MANELKIRAIPKREASQNFERLKYIWDNFYSDDSNENTKKLKKLCILNDLSSWFSIIILFTNLVNIYLK